MKLSELYRVVNLLHRPGHYQDPEVVIAIRLPYVTVGAQPTVAVQSMYQGIDWDSGKCVITPAEELSPRDRDFAAQMKAMQDRAGWAEYENLSLKAEIRRLKKQLKENQ
jgi:hypothetical protein